MWIEPDSSALFPLVETIEGELLVSGDPRLSLSEIRDMFVNVEVPNEADLEFALAEVEDRALRLGVQYPFCRDGDAIAIRGDTVMYGALLLLSLRKTPLRDGKEFRRSDDVLDVIAREAARAALGVGAEAVVFGAPPRDGRPESFPDAVQWVAERIGVGLRSAEAYPEAADGGVDVVAWNRFPDYEVGFPLIIVQNTIQIDFMKKARDAVPEDWREWLRVKAAPMVGFAVPFAMAPNDDWWNRSASNVTYMWDRRRLVWQLRDSDPEKWSEWESLRTFVGEEIARIRDRLEVEDPSPRRPSVVRGRKPGASAPIVGRNPSAGA